LFNFFSFGPTNVPTAHPLPTYHLGNFLFTFATHRQGANRNSDEKYPYRQPIRSQLNPYCSNTACCSGCPQQSLLWLDFPFGSRLSWVSSRLCGFLFFTRRACPRGIFSFGFPPLATGVLAFSHSPKFFFRPTVCRSPLFFEFYEDTQALGDFLRATSSLNPLSLFSLCCSAPSSINFFFIRRFSPTSLPLLCPLVVQM